MCLRSADVSRVTPAGGTRCWGLLVELLEGFLGAALSPAVNVWV